MRSMTWIEVLSEAGAASGFMAVRAIRWCNAIFSLYHNAKSDHKRLAQRFTAEAQIYFIPEEAVAKGTNAG
jgi:hypothetical protein